MGIEIGTRIATVVAAGLLPALVWAAPAGALPVPSPAPQRAAIVAAHPFTLGPGAVGPSVTNLKTRLRWLGYPVSAGNRYDASTVAAMKKFQVKFFLNDNGKLDQPTWAVLQRVTRNVGVLPAQCKKGTMAFCVDKRAKVLRWIVKGKVAATLDARFGMPGNETGEGLFRIWWKDWDHTSSLYGTWMPRAMFFNGAQAVHYSPYFARDGYYGGSHGCINIRDFKAISFIFQRTPVGTPVYVYWAP